MIFRLVKTALCLSVVLFSGILIVYEKANAESANVEIRAEGTATLPFDVINGHQAMAQNNFPIWFYLSVETDFVVTYASLGFVFYSPDASITTITHDDLPEGDDFPEWFNAFTTGGAQILLRSYDGILPDSFFAGGAAFSGGFGPTSLQDISDFSIIPDSGAEGIFCIDTSFISPTGPWLFLNSVNIFPSWGGSVGGYPDGGYCITIYEGCCDLPGDADGNGSVDVADIIFILKYIFSNGPAPGCLAEGDFDGKQFQDLSIVITDVVYLHRFVFVEGPAPVCGNQF
ncbi:MAG: hypothetical protein IIB00_06730 [candidate division Zixibacteria bacterium]|nr:hypothetical protein [candidate division Zixibacteria bacterium]